MITYEDAFETKRDKVAALVDRLAEGCGSRMDAYAALGRKLGLSERWVRRVVSRDPTVRIDFHVAMRIRDLHDRLCVRVARAADAAEARNALIQEQIDAAVQASSAAGVRLDGAAEADLTPPRRPAPAPQPALAFASPRTRGPAQASLELSDLPLFPTTAPH